MSRGKHRFTQGDVTKALKAAVNAGVAIERVEIEQTGKIVVVIAKPHEDAANDNEAEEKNEWDDVLP